MPSGFPAHKPAGSPAEQDTARPLLIWRTRGAERGFVLVLLLFLGRFAYLRLARNAISVPPVLNAPQVAQVRR